MNTQELFDLVAASREKLSKKRGYEVQVDSPVCILLCSIIHDLWPESQVKIIKLADDFQAVIIGEVNQARSLVDPTYLYWRKNKPVEQPSNEESTLVLPFDKRIEPRAFISHFFELMPEYTNALIRFWREEIR